MKLIKYVIIKGDTVSEIQVRVNNKIKRGYEPHGNLLMIAKGYNVTIDGKENFIPMRLVQPMVLRECQHLFFSKEITPNLFERTCAYCGAPDVRNFTENPE